MACAKLKRSAERVYAAVGTSRLLLYPLIVVIWLVAFPTYGDILVNGAYGRIVGIDLTSLVVVWYFCCRDGWQLVLIYL